MSALRRLTSIPIPHTFTLTAEHHDSLPRNSEPKGPRSSKAIEDARVPSCQGPSNEDTQIPRHRHRGVVEWERGAGPRSRPPLDIGHEEVHFTLANAPGREIELHVGGNAGAAKGASLQDLSLDQLQDLVGE